MQFGHEQLDVYRVAIRYVAWAYEMLIRIVAMLTKLGQRSTRCERIRRYDNLDPRQRNGAKKIP